MMRDKTIDVMRGIAIILVVVDHAGGKWGVINLFHVPLFFFISGCFFRPNKERMGLQELVRHMKWKAAYFPFVKYGILFLLLSPFLYKLKISAINVSSFSDFLKDVSLILRFRTAVSDMLGQFWFLPVLFFSHALCLAIHKFTPPNKRSKHGLILIFVGIYLVGMCCFIKGIKEPYDFSRIMYLSFYYVLGYYSYKYLEFVYALNWVFPVITVIALQVICPYSYIVYSSSILFLITSIAGIMMTAWVAKHTGSFISEILSMVGRHTMPVFVWHVIIIKVVQLLLSKLTGLNYYPGWHGSMDANGCWWLYTLCGVAVPVLLTYTINKIRNQKKTC